MRYLISKFAWKSNEWRIISNTDTGEFEAWANNHCTKCVSLHEAQSHVERQIKVALDLRPYAAGQQIEIPMSDGSKKTMTVLQNNPDAVTLTDDNSGEQMKVPHFLSGGNAAVIPGANNPANPNEGTEQQGTGISVVTPGTGIKISVKDMRRVKMPIKATHPGMTQNTGPDNPGSKGFEARPIALSASSILSIKNIWEAWADIEKTGKIFYGNQDRENFDRVYESLIRFLELAQSELGVDTNLEIKIVDRLYHQATASGVESDDRKMLNAFIKMDLIESQVHDEVLEATSTKREDWYARLREPSSKSRDPFLNELWEEKSRLESTGRRVAFITGNPGSYHVKSEEGKNLGGPYKTREQAEKRLRQVEYFKHKKSQRLVVAEGDVRNPYFCKHDGTYLERDTGRPRKVCPSCGMLYTSQVYPSLSIKDISLRLADVIRPEVENPESGLISRILEAHNQNGGSTFTAQGENVVGKPGFAVSLYPERSVIIQGPLSAEDLRSFIDQNNDLLMDPRVVIGTWNNGSKNYLDISAVIQDKEQAIALGKKYNQIAIFDLQKLQEIPTGGTGEPVEGLPSEIDRLAFRVVAQPPETPSEHGTPDLPPGSNPEQGRVLSRHEIVDRAEQIIRDALYKDMKPGVYEIVEHMQSVYGNSPDELYAGVTFAWQKVQYEEEGDFSQNELEETHNDTPVTPAEMSEAPLYQRV